MNLWQIGFKNVWQNRNRYLAYLASSIFSVMIYFLYSTLVYHPQLQGGYSHAAQVVMGMRAAAIVIAIFTFLFLLYSNSAFIRSRMKEFGLLSLLGVSKGQLIRIILGESLFIAAIAIAGGLGLGLLLQRLFFMAISVLMQLTQQLPLYAGMRVWVETLVVFGTIFVLVSFTSLWKVIRRNTIEMIRARRQPKAVPVFSKWRSLLGLLLVGGGYAWACASHPQMVGLGIIPVTLMVSVGTYFVLREGSIALFTMLHRREKYFYRPGPFLTISQLIYKIQDNYRVLAAATILIAVILSAMGTAFSIYAVGISDTTNRYPRAIQLLQTGEADHVAAVEQVDAVLHKQGLTDVTYRDFTTLKARIEVPRNKSSNIFALAVYMVPYSFYNDMRRSQYQIPQLKQENDVILIYPHLAGLHTTAQLKVDGHTQQVGLVYDESQRILNPGPEISNVLVVPDALLDKLVQKSPTEKHVHFALWDTNAWRSRKGQMAVGQLRQLFQFKANPVLSTTWEVYRSSISSVGLALFIGFFVSLVFFAASCSLLYFRLFTEIDDDRQYYRQLQRVGVTTLEVKRIALCQALVIFFTPFVGGIIHSSFAMQALGTLLNRRVLQLGWMVALVYLVLYAIYFTIAYAFHWRTLRTGLIERNGI